MSDLLVFKSVAIKQGDVIALAPNEGKTLIPSGAEVAVIDVHVDGYLTVLLPTSLAYLGDKWHLLNIPPTHLENFRVVEEAINAIPRRSGHQRFVPRDHVACQVGGERLTGTVVAAIDGTVAATVDNRLMTGLAKYFIKTEKAEFA